MKLQLAALIATYVIAITAVFVVWPAIGTAPWENAPSRFCEGSLGNVGHLAARDYTLQAYADYTGDSPSERQRLQRAIDRAQRMVDRYC